MNQIYADQQQALEVEQPAVWPPVWEALREQFAEGLMYAHSRANANTSKVLEVASFSYALIELLSERGIISIAELDERKKVVSPDLEKLFQQTNPNGVPGLVQISRRPAVAGECVNGAIH